MVTTRTDAAAYFAARYGEYVQVEVVGDRPECLYEQPGGDPVGVVAGIGPA